MLYKSKKTLKNLEWKVVGSMDENKAFTVYFPSDHKTHPNEFKGMAQILEERARKCLPSAGKSLLIIQKAPRVATCSEWCTTLNQPDCSETNSALANDVRRRGHRFLLTPKYHCGLNFFEQSQSVCIGCFLPHQKGPICWETSPNHWIVCLLSQYGTLSQVHGLLSERPRWHHSSLGCKEVPRPSIYSQWHLDPPCSLTGC